MSVGNIETMQSCAFSGCVNAIRIHAFFISSGRGGFVTLQRDTATSATGQQGREQTRTSQSSAASTASKQTRRPKQVAPIVSHLAVRQRNSGPAIRPPVCYNPGVAYGHRGKVGSARYPPPAFVGTGGGTGRQPSVQVIRMLEAEAKDLARECIEQGTHVDASRICQALLRQRKAEDFKALGLRRHWDIPYIRELERLQRRVYETITAYCQVRATSTLYELGKYLAQMEEKEDFEELGLGPLLEQPPVYQFFKPRRTLVAVPEITTRDVLEYLRSYMDTKYKWRGRIDFRDFLRFMTRERGCADPYELCVRVPSLGLSISVSLICLLVRVISGCMYSFALLRC